MNTYLQLTIEAIVTASFVVAIVGSKIYQTILQITKLNFKPFNCSLCSAFWFYLCMHLDQGIYAIMYAGLTYFFADWFEKKLNTF